MADGSMGNCFSTPNGRGTPYPLMIPTPPPTGRGRSLVATGFERSLRQTLRVGVSEEKI